MTITPLGSAVEPEVYCRKASVPRPEPGSRQPAAAAASSWSVASRRTAASSGTAAARPPSFAARSAVVSARAGRASRAMARRRGRLRLERGG